MRAARIGGLVAMIVAGTCYPYLPGAHDPLAVPLSAVLQAGSAFGLLLVPLGAFWLTRRSRSSTDPARPACKHCHQAAVAGLAVVGVVAGGVALATSGLLFALAMLAAWAALLAALKGPARDPSGAPRSETLPIALVVVPVLAVGLQVALSGPLRDFSRGTAIESGSVLVEDLARHHATHERYPDSITALWPDYKVAVIGIERFHYTRHDDSYTLHFEQPVPLWQAPGTRELVAYNPHGRHLVLSHAAWHVTRPPAFLADRPGWYAVRDLARRGWRSFLFD